KEKNVSITHIGYKKPKDPQNVDQYFVCDIDSPEKIQNLNIQREYDYILVAESIEKIKNAEEVLEQVQTYLKPSGKMILAVSNIALWFYRLSLLIGRFNYGQRGPLQKDHVHLYTKDTARQLVRRSGMEIIKEKNVTFPFEVLFESIGKSRVVKFVEGFYFILATVWPQMFSYQFIMEAKITQLNYSRGEGKVSKA
ncbi:MAG: methyltransferase domain-containing protein, partial [Bdellovibrionales bacterium]